MNRKQRLTLLATVIGSGAVILDSTVVNLALPKIGINLHGSFSDLQWITDGYMLSLSALLLLGGSIGDIFGRKRAYLTGLVGFGVTSLVCGLAPTAGFLIAARILQGAFGALLVPGGLAIINTNFPPGQRGRAIGTWSAWSAIFAPLGPILGGYILDISSWRWIFFINVPLVIVCYICGQAGISESNDPGHRRLDLRGAAVAGLALGGITYGLIEGPTVHWGIKSVLPLVLGLILSILFIVLERRTADPLVRLNFFQNRNFSVSNLMTFGLYGALSGFLFAFIIYVQTVVHYSSIAAGVSILPLPIFVFLFSRRFGALAGKYGPRAFMTSGSLLVAVGIFSLIRLHAGSSYWPDILPGMLLFGFGMSLVVAPLTTTVMGALSDNNSGIASAINNAVSRVAGLVVVAVLGIFGSAHAYHFSIILCACLAAAAGFVSLMIASKPLSKNLP